MDVSPEVEIDYAGSVVALAIGFAIVGLAALLFYLFVLRPLGKYTDETAKKVEEERAAEQARQQAVHQKFHREYEQRKQAIGRIVCPQCKWSGNWGDGMSYQEFFVYELFSNNVIPTEEIDLNIHYMNTQAQYKCPMCQSTNWQKV